MMSIGVLIKACQNWVKASLASEVRKGLVLGVISDNVAFAILNLADFLTFVEFLDFLISVKLTANFITCFHLSLSGSF